MWFKVLNIPRLYIYDIFFLTIPFCVKTPRNSRHCIFNWYFTNFNHCLQYKKAVKVDVLYMMFITIHLINVLGNHWRGNMSDFFLNKNHSWFIGLVFYDSNIKKTNLWKKIHLPIDQPHLPIHSHINLQCCTWDIIL